MVVSVSVAVSLLYRPPPLLAAELPLMVQSVSVAVPKFSSPPPKLADPAVIVSAESVAVAPAPI